jgi:hypothetical protein
LNELREFRQLREENRKLKTLVADLTLDKYTWQEVLSRKSLKPAARRHLVNETRQAYHLIEKRACGLIGITRWSNSPRPHPLAPTRLLERVERYPGNPWEYSASVITSKPAIHDHFKTGQRSRTQDMKPVVPRHWQFWQADFASCGSVRPC